MRPIFDMSNQERLSGVVSVVFHVFEGMLKTSMQDYDGFDFARLLYSFIFRRQNKTHFFAGKLQGLTKLPATMSRGNEISSSRHHH